MTEAEFACEGCGVVVITFGTNKRPVHQLCAVCAWLCEEVPDPEEMWKLYSHLKDNRA